MLRILAHSFLSTACRFAYASFLLLRESLAVPYIVQDFFLFSDIDDEQKNKSEKPRQIKSEVFE